MMTKQRKDIYETITTKIVSMIEAGVAPWQKPWTTRQRVCRPLRSNGKPYSGINVLVLWAEARVMGYKSPYWFTYKQAQALKAYVRKGEHGTRVVFASTFEKLKTDEETGEQRKQRIPFLREYTVFNADQIEGLPRKYFPQEEKPTVSGNQRSLAVEDFVSKTGAAIAYGGDRACYTHGSDLIRMPSFEDFHTSAGYYGTLLHELTHWTGAAHRLKRDFANAYGSEGYAFEELVAEIGSTFLCADLGLLFEPREESVAYTAGWLKVLKSDKRAIFRAASLAAKASEFLSGVSEEEEVN